MRIENKLGLARFTCLFFFAVFVFQSFAVVNDSYSLPTEVGVIGEDPGDPAECGGAPAAGMCSGTCTEGACAAFYFKCRKPKAGLGTIIGVVCDVVHLDIGKWMEFINDGKFLDALLKCVENNPDIIPPPTGGGTGLERCFPPKTREDIQFCLGQGAFGEGLAAMCKNMKCDGTCKCKKDPLKPCAEVCGMLNKKSGDPNTVCEIKDGVPPKQEQNQEAEF